MEVSWGEGIEVISLEKAVPTVVIANKATIAKDIITVFLFAIMSHISG